MIFITESVDDDEDLSLHLQQLSVNLLAVVSYSAGKFSPD